MRFKNSFLLIAFFLSFSMGIAGQCFSNEIAVDGEVQNGYRILTLQQIDQIQNFQVYRGDYIKFRLPGQIDETQIVFPTLEKRKIFTKDLETASYIKMKKLGEFPFEADTIKGTITVVEYQQSSYKVVTAKEAGDFIKNGNHLILDVRTPGEYKAGHIENAVLVPVQILHSNLEKLANFKNKPILIYCATGNRSTVASKIMIDSGFKQILNLGQGIVDWHKKGFPVIR